MFLRAGVLSRAIVPIIYFSVLAIAFFSDFIHQHFTHDFRYIFYLQWFAWGYGAPLSVLLILQIAQISKMPDLKQYWVLGLPIIAFLAAKYVHQGSVMSIEMLLTVTGLIASGVSLLAIWTNRGVFQSTLEQKAGRERYWLILALIVMNIGFLAIMLASLHEEARFNHIMFVRTLLGLGGIYIVTTSLFRIYPQAVYIKPKKNDGDGALSVDEIALAMKIETLLTLDKVYHEHAYSRTDLARECGASEAAISKVTNQYFGKSLPQLLNEHRIDDAKRLLRQTDASIAVISEEVGFNSLPSFNRAFKNVVGVSPSEFRGG
jgi:AraC-like DNA-binding protein